MATWARVLLAVPNSVLLLKSDMFNVERQRRAFAARFASAARAAAGAGAAEALPGRLRLIHYAQSEAEHYAAYGGMDVALDTFPYAGTTTTVRARRGGAPLARAAASRGTWPE